MKISKLSDMKDGWFIGNFFPTAFSTTAFEVCYKKHYKGELWDTHYHEFSTEINLLISGKMTINGIELNDGDIFTIEPHYVSSPIFLEDCTLIIIKTPSIPGDKKIV